MAVSFIPVGGAIVSIDAPDRNGRLANVVLAHANLESYRSQKVYLGAVCGRFANRIAGAAFELDGARYKLAPTDGTSSVHGGRHGFDKAEWAVISGVVGATQWARLTHRSPDGEEGYPGNLEVTMIYALDAAGAFEIRYEATTDQATVVSLTNHSYFNLSGEGSGTVLDHVLEIQAERYTPSDGLLIPTGDVTSVAGTPFDFRTPRSIGERIGSAHPQMRAGRGYDVNYVVGTGGAALVRVARAHDPISGRSLTVETTAPGMQFYSANNLDGTIQGPSGTRYPRFGGFCLEPHHYPDTPNKPGFPSARLDRGQRYVSVTRYGFGSV